MMTEILQIWIERGFLWYFSAINIFYTVFLLIASIKVLTRIKEIREEDTSPILSSNSLPSILFIIPMYNESKNIVPNILNILNLSYRYKKVIAVNDGSEDDTMAVLIDELELVQIPKYYSDEIPTQKVRTVYQSKLYPEIVVIDKDHGGKYDTVNAAVNAAPNPFFVVLDADTFVDSKGFEALIRPILTSSTTIAVGASVRISNGCEINYNRVSTASFPKDFLPAMQSLEYLRAFLLREGLDAINGNFIIAGAFSIFPRDLIIEVGGFGPTVGEDVEIIVRLHRVMKKRGTKYWIRYLPDPVAWTLAPNDLRSLGRQRSRWHLGLLESLWFHKRVFLNPFYGVFGLFGYPVWFFAEALEPLVETLAWIYVIATWRAGTLNLEFFLLLLAVSYGFTALYTIFSLAVEEYSFRRFPTLKSLSTLLFANTLENIGYRQMTVYWRLRGFYWFFKKIKEVHKSSLFINGLVKTATSKLPKK